MRAWAGARYGGGPADDHAPRRVCSGNLAPRMTADTGGGSGAASPTWSSWSEAVGVVCHRPHLRTTLLIAVVVGTVLFCINQLDVVLRGDATTAVWI